MRLGITFVLLFLVVVLAACVQQPSGGSAGGAATRAHGLVDDDASVGPADAKVVVVEFSDFECPSCAKAEPNVKRLLQEYGDRIRFVYRDFPIDKSCNKHVVVSLHPSSCKAAQAAECAKDQGKFWKYHEILMYETMNATADQRDVRFSDLDLKVYAAHLGLDAGRFAACLDTGEKLAEVQKDIQDAINAEIQVTPTFYVNNLTVEGAVPYKTLKNAVESAWNSSTS